MPRLKHHVRQVLTVETHPAPYLRMVLCAFATCMPLSLGFLQDELGISIYGGLIGYLLALNTDTGGLRHRLTVVTVTLLILVGGFVAGLRLHDHQAAYYLAFSALVYWLGMLAGQGIELERACLFAATSMVIAHNTKAFHPQALHRLLLYVAVAYGCLISGLIGLEKFRREAGGKALQWAGTIRSSLASRRDRHIHAVSYVVMALFSIWLAQQTGMERGHWITVTVLLVMKPDRTQALYKGAQRLLGTVAGVAAVEVMLPFLPGPREIIPFIVGCAFSVPWALKRNYWLVSLFVTVMVVLLLELAAAEQGNEHTPFVRLYATLIGCGLGAVGAGLSKLGDRFRAGGRPQTQP